MYTPAILYLSKNGDKLQVGAWEVKKGHFFFRKIDPSRDNVYPLLKDVKSIKSHLAVLEFLQKLEEDRVSRPYIHFWHEHHVEYLEHMGGDQMTQKGKVHQDTLETMIAFVNSRLNDQRLKGVKKLFEY